MASSSRSRDISQAEWEQYRAEVASLFQTKTYQEIIDHLDRKFNFRPSQSQFALQVRARWKLKKNFKRKALKNVFDALLIEGERPAEILVENRLISYKKLRKAAVATSTAERQQPAAKELVAGPEAVHNGTRHKSPITDAFKPVQKIHQSDSEDQHDVQAPFGQLRACLNTIHSSTVSELGSTLSRAVYLQLLARGVLPAAQPAEEEFTKFTATVSDVVNRAIRRLQSLADELAQRGVLKRIRTQSGWAEFLTSVHLLRSKIYEVSNNRFDTTAMAELLAWISKEQLLWVVEILIDHQLPTMTIFADVLFRTAVAARDTITVAALLARGVHPRGGENGSARPLRVAIENRDAAMVRLLLAAGAEMDSVQEDLVVAFKGPEPCPIIIRLLFEHGASIHVRIGQAVGSMSLLNRALELNATDVVKILPVRQMLAHDDQYKGITTALQMAAKHCDSDTVQMLISAGSDVNIPLGPKYATGRESAVSMGNADYFITPLQQAVNRNDHAMAKILLDNGAYVQCFDNYDLFPGGCYITKKGQIKAGVFSRCRHKRTCSPGYEKSDYLSQKNEHLSPLEAAAVNKSSKMVRLLLRHLSIAIHRVGALGAALQVACMQSDNMDIIRMLVSVGADVNSPPHWWHDQTALQEAILSGDMNAVDYLISKGADFRARAGNMHALTALQAAITMKNVGLTKNLIALGACVDEETLGLSSERLLNLAARSGNLELFDLLVANGISVGMLSSRTRLPHSHSILLDAISSGSHVMVERLLATDIELQNEVRQRFDVGYVALAIMHGRGQSFRTVDLLLSQGASPNMTGRDHKTPLQLAIQHEAKRSLISLLIRNDADVNRTHTESSALLEAIRKQDEMIIDCLIHAGSKVDLLVIDDAQSPLVVAVSTGNLGIIRLVFDSMENINCAPVFAALTKAIGSNQSEAVQLLLSRAVDARHMRIKERSFKERPLRTAIEKKNHSFINMLLEHDVCFYSRDRWALAQAACNGDIQLVKRLLALNTEFDSNSRYDSLSIYDEALKEAVSQKHAEIVQVLIAAGADVNTCWRKTTDSPTLTCMLNEAITSESFTMVNLFLDNGAHVNGPGAFKQWHSATPFQTAAKQGNSRIIQLLLDSGAEVNKDALDAAAEHGRLDTVHKLLRLDKEPETLPERTKEAAKFAMLGNHPIVAQYLIDWQTK